MLRKDCRFAPGTPTMLAERRWEALAPFQSLRVLSDRPYGLPSFPHRFDLAHALRGTRLRLSRGCATRPQERRAIKLSGSLSLKCPSPSRIRYRGKKRIGC